MKLKLYLPLFTCYLPLVLLLSLSCLSSCGHYFYAPSENGLLNIQEGGDLKIGGSISGGSQEEEGRRRSLSGQLAYSPIKGIGIQAGATLWRDQGAFVEDNFWAGATDSDFGDIALGNYWLLNKNHPTAENGLKFIWDNYVGFGSGNIQHRQEPDAGYELDLHKYFFQTHISVSMNDRISFGIFFRPTWINYRQASVYGSLSSNIVDDIEYLKTIPFPLFMETGFNIQGGWERVQFSFSSRIQTNQANSGQMNNNFRQIPVVPLTANLGIVLDVDDFFTKKKDKKPKY